MANQNRSRNRSSSSSAVTGNDEFDRFDGKGELMISVSGQKPVASVYTLVCCCCCCDAKVKSISCGDGGEGVIWPRQLISQHVHGPINWQLSGNLPT